MKRKAGSMWSAQYTNAYYNQGNTIYVLNSLDYKLENPKTITENKTVKVFPLR